MRSLIGADARKDGCVPNTSYQALIGQGIDLVT